MSEYVYHIILHTELGKKSGKLKLNIQGDIINGVIDILGESTPCKGKIDASGRCSLQGQLKTFMNTIDYEGDGYADSQKVDFDLRDGRHFFHMVGETCQQER